MKKNNLGVIFGGLSTEHEVSIESAISVIKNLDSNKYNIFPIYISKKGDWYKYIGNINTLDSDVKEREKIENVTDFVKGMDVIFPVLHGLYGEDGTIQGMLDLLNIPYVGCKVLSSSVCMDKAYTKVILNQAGIKQVPHMYIRKTGDSYKYIDNSFNEKLVSIKKLADIAVETLGFPMFIKPSNSGSSVGINKATTKRQLIKYIKYASCFDKKILIEKGVDARELECAVLNNNDEFISCIGEVLPADSFYSYDAKYNNSESTTVIPADIPKAKEEQIKIISKKVFNALDCNQIARIDFFLDKATNELYVNEINTMPGFTNISMYPKLISNTGISYSFLLDKLIENAINK